MKFLFLISYSYFIAKFRMKQDFVFRISRCLQYFHTIWLLSKCSKTIEKYMNIFVRFLSENRNSNAEQWWNTCLNRQPPPYCVLFKSIEMEHIKQKLLTKQKESFPFVLRSFVRLLTMHQILHGKFAGLPFKIQNRIEQKKYTRCRKNTCIWKIRNEQTFYPLKMRPK